MSSSSVAARAARVLPLALLVSAAASLSSCGTDDGVSSFLPPGRATTAPPGNLVMYVAQAVGDRIDAFRLGTDGLLPAQPFDTISVHNPRRLAIANGTLYATLEDQIVSMRLGADGSLPTVPTSETLPGDDDNKLEPVDLEVRDNILYVASGGLEVVQSYALDSNGNLPAVYTSFGLSEYAADFLSIALNGPYLYSGARDTQFIDVFLLRQDGHLPPLAEPQDPSNQVSLPDDMEIRNGIVYVTSASDRSVRAYRIQPNGYLPAYQDSRTATEEYYSDILLDGNMLYAAAYNEGRIDLYTIEPDGMLPGEKPVFSTKGDPTSYPSHMAMNGGILYVTQSGLDRVDAFVLGTNGLPPKYPSSSTDPGSPDSAPLDLVLYDTN